MHFENITQELPVTIHRTRRLPTMATKIIKKKRRSHVILSQNFIEYPLLPSLPPVTCSIVSFSMEWDKFCSTNSFNLFTVDEFKELRKWIFSDVVATSSSILYNDPTISINLLMICEPLSSVCCNRKTWNWCK